MKKAVTFGFAAALLLTGIQGAMAQAVPIGASDAGQPLSGDPAAGKKIFVRCVACHATEAGVNKIGPSLHGILGRKAGTVPNFSYSKANLASGIVWDEQVLFDYLKNPQAMVKGTKMAFPGIPKPQERADLIAFIQQTTK